MSVHKSKLSQDRKDEVPFSLATRRSRNPLTMVTRSRVQNMGISIWLLTLIQPSKSRLDVVVPWMGDLRKRERLTDRSKSRKSCCCHRRSLNSVWVVWSTNGRRISAHPNSPTTAAKLELQRTADPRHSPRLTWSKRVASHPVLWKNSIDNSCP